MTKVQANILTLTIVYHQDQDKILLVNRPENKGFPGFIGPGGKVELTESLTEGAAREVREETGLIVNPTDLIFKGVEEFTIPNENYRYIVFNYITTKFTGKLLNDGPEGKPEWICRKDLDTIPMQDWFRRRLSLIFEEGTFEIFSQLKDLHSPPIVKKIKQLV
jgi:8-oxo-dGTP diphosphatase